MANKNYDRGRQFEYTVLNKLKEQGYDGIRSAGSHSPIDLLVWIAGDGIKYVGYDKFHIIMLDFFAIQCKHSIKGDVNFKTLLNESNVIKLAEMPDNFTKVLCIKQSRSREIIQLVYDNPNCDALSSPTSCQGKWILRKIFDI